MYKNISEIITDVDGVLTDGSFLYSEKGKIYKRFGPHDSDGVKILRSMDISIRSITADKKGFEITKKRTSDLNIDLILVPEEDRLNWIKSNCNLKTTAFIGDGLYDAAVMKICALSFAPANAVDLTKKFATKVIDTYGGNGVLLSIALMFLKNRNPRSYYDLERGL